MQKLIQIFKQYAVFILFLILELIGFSFLIKYNTYHQIKYLSWINDVTGGVYQKLTDATEYMHLREANKVLAEENARLHQQLKQAYLNTENRFNPWVDTTYHQNYVYRTAEVINNQLSHTHNYLMLNRGKLAGIGTEMGVINANGVVGIVTDVSNHYAVVMSILNPDLHLGVRLKHTEFFGILTWDGENINHSVLHNIQGFVQLQKGDTVETIGASGIFPEGIMVGTIDTFALNNETNMWEIRILLSADIQKAKHVYVLENIFAEEIKELEQP